MAGMIEDTHRIDIATGGTGQPAVVKPGFDRGIAPPVIGGGKAVHRVEKAAGITVGGMQRARRAVFAPGEAREVRQARIADVRIVATLVAMTVEGSMALRDVKNHLSEVVDQVEREHDRVVITKHGRPAAVVVSIDDLASLEETLDIAGRPQLMRQVRTSLTELSAGDAEVITKDEILRTFTA